MINVPGKDFYMCDIIWYNLYAFTLHWQEPKQSLFDNHEVSVLIRKCQCSGFYDWSPSAGTEWNKLLIAVDTDSFPMVTSPPKKSESFANNLLTTKQNKWHQLKYSQIYVVVPIIRSE